MTGVTDGGELEPERRLLSYLDGELHSSIGLDRAVAPFVQQETCPLECVRPILHDPSRAEVSSSLFVGRRHEYDVAVEWNLRAPESKECLELSDAECLCIERAAPEDDAVSGRGREGICVPVLRICRHDVHVMQQHERRLVTTLESCPDVTSPGG